MPSLESLRRELRPTLSLALPLILAELGWMVMGIVDTLMAGRLPDSAAAIGTVSLGSILFYTGAIFAGAMLFGLDTVVSQAFGARKLDDCHRALWNALYLGAALAPVAIAVNAIEAALLPSFGANPAVVPGAARYIRILNWGVVPLLLFFALRRYLQAMGQAKPITFALVTANLINLFGNWVLIYGHLGFRGMGTDGSAWATVMARVYMAGGLIAWALWYNRSRHGTLFRVSRAPDRARLATLVRLGLPAAVHVDFGLWTGLSLGLILIGSVLVLVWWRKVAELGRGFKRPKMGQSIA